MFPPPKSATGSTPLITLTNISYAHKDAERPISILKNINLSIMSGESCALLGESGSGKSTLLNILGLLDQPTSGTYLLNGTDCSRASATQLALIRSHKIGFVFQNFNLLPRMTAVDNVALPLLYRGVDKSTAQERARELIQQVGLEDRAHHRPPELSGGQRQRIAIARALIGAPSLILADEPTGSLDAVSANEIVDILLHLNEYHSVSLVVVTHDKVLSTLFQRSITIKNGELHEIPAT